MRSLECNSHTRTDEYICVLFSLNNADSAFFVCIVVAWKIT